MNNNQIIGLKEALKFFDEADKKSVKALRTAIKDAAKPVLNDAKSRAPVSADGSHGRPPGTLKKDITVIAEKAREKTKYVVRVGLKRRKSAKALDENGVPYGVYVEYGTSKEPAQPYLRPALNENREETEDRIVEEIIGTFIK